LSTSAASRFHRLLDGDPEAVLLTDATGRVLGANPAACRLLGRTAPTIDGPALRGSWRR
jgi:PAS domain-containing protein